MREFHIHVSELREYIPQLTAGDRVLLSGTVYTSRDAAHQRIFERMENDQPLPYPIQDAVIYYAGPTPTPDGRPIGSCGPTTSSRMDPYTPKLHDLGLMATIGKGARSKEVCASIQRNQAVYFCALGGAGALASQCISEAEVIAFEDLGCESVKRLTLNNFPLTVAIDSFGHSIFDR